MAELGIQPESAYIYVDMDVIVHHADSDVIMQVHNSCISLLKHSQNI